MYLMFALLPPLLLLGAARADPSCTCPATANLVCSIPGNPDRCNCFPPGGGFLPCNHYWCCGDGAGRRRHLKQSADLVLVTGNEPRAQEVLAKCGEREYDAFLHISNSHIYALASPSSSSSREGEGAMPDTTTTTTCPYLAGHVNFAVDTTTSDSSSTKDDRAQKEILLWENPAEAASKFDKDETLYIGTFALSDIKQAYESTSANKPGSDKYNVIGGNHCGIFVLHLARNLGVHVNAEMTAFVARRLWEQSSTQFIDTIRRGLNFPSLIKGRHYLRTTEQISDEEVVKHLVESQVSELLA